VAKLDDDQGGVNMPESAALTGLVNLYKLVFVTGAMGFTWLVGIGGAFYYSWVSANGSFAQGFAANCLSALILLLVAPVLFSVVLRKPRRYSVVVAIAAAVVLLCASRTEGALRAVLLNLGTGLWFVLAIDFNIVHRFKAWCGRLEKEAQDAAKDIHLVL
jgi:hypothetical protein